MSNTAPAKTGGESREGILALSRPHLAPSRAIAAKDAILQAVNVLENENEELRRYNAKILAELDTLRKENAKLRKDLDCTYHEKDDVAGKFSALEKDNIRLQHELENQIRALKQEKQKITTTENQFKEENEQFRRQAEQLKSQIFQKDNEIRIVSKDMDTLRREMDKSSRINISDRDFEIMHELESLKNERKDLILDREELGKSNSKLRNELKNLEIQLDEKAAELKNENRRHSLLTKEFNSLLEENNHLKLQLRRRSQRHSIAMGSRDDSSVSSSMPDGSRALRSSRKYSSNLALNREPTISAVSDERMSLRDASLTSTRKLSREQSNMTTTSTRDSSSSYYAQPHHTARDLAAGGKKLSRDCERGFMEPVHGSSPDILPSIPGSSKTGTWKP